MSCSAPSSSSSQQTLQHVLQSSSTASARCPRVRHLISGTFNSNALHILSFDTLTRTLSLLSTLPAYGPHSFLTQGRTSGAVEANKLVDTVYATTWAEKKEICAWKLEWQHDSLNGLRWLGNVPITATSSYVHVQPPPFHSLTTPSYGVSPGPSRFLYSAGGPTGEVHAVDVATGALQAKVQQIVFLRGGEGDLEQADKTRKALRYGAHNVDMSTDGLAFIADVGRNAILTYAQHPSDGQLTLVSETPMPAEMDGPRHVVPSPCGRFVYSVTEHTSFVDVYAVKDAGKTLRHLQRVSILSRDKDIHNFRGDTVRLSPDGRHVFATTRGMHAGTKGYVKVWKIDEEALEASFDDEQAGEILHETVTYETRNSGGKANAIEFAPRYASSQGAVAVDAEGGAGTIDYAVLTDDEQGFITVLEWDGSDLRDADTIKLPLLASGEAQGASQAVWVS